MESDSQPEDAAMTSLARAMMSMLMVMPVADGVGDSDPPGAELPTGNVHPSQLPWDRIDTVAVLGSGPMWDEPPFYRVFDAVLDNGAMPSSWSTEAMASSFDTMSGSPGGLRF